MHTILVVDDDLDVRRLLESCLTAEGYDVVTAANGWEALQRLETCRPSIILLDLMMPVMDGETFRGHQQREPALQQIPVVCLSAKHDARTIAAQLGAMECFQKPFDLDCLVAAVRRHCVASSPERSQHTSAGAPGAPRGIPEAL
jgi:CheY-like chemotaxis protein